MAVRIKYEGPDPQREVWGLHFPIGQAVEVENEALAARALSCAHFVEVKRGRPKKAKADAENER